MSFHKGLTKEAVVAAAKELIEEKGESSFSMRLLAEKLEIKTASLYTHIVSLDILRREVGLLALKEQRDILFSAIDGKYRESAIIALSRQ